MSAENSKTFEVSDELLNAFVDDELDAAEKSRLLDRMVNDASAQLRSRVCQLWHLKELVRNAYPQEEALAPLSEKRGAPRGLPLRRYSQALAAGLVLSMGAAMGWFAHEGKGTPPGLGLTAGQMAGGKIILHVAFADSKRFEAALNEAEELSQGRDRSGSPVQVELVANEGGLNLFRADVSPYADRIEAIGKAHQNVSFLACNNTIEKLRSSGTSVRLLPHVVVAPSVAERIMTRVQHGWTYIQV